MKMNYKSIGLLLTGLTVLSLNACNNDDPAFGSTYDINWPMATITSISPVDSALVSSTLTVTGTGLDKVSSVTIDNRTMTIVDKTATTLTATLPRKFNASAVTIANLYRRNTISAKSLAPKYPAIKVSAFPAEITKGQAIVITGTDLDLVTSIIVGSNVVAVSSSNTTSLTIQTAGLKLNAGETVVVEVKSTYSKVLNKSIELDVIE